MLAIEACLGSLVCTFIVYYLLRVRKACQVFVLHLSIAAIFDGLQFLHVSY